jgi:hypothetical protein
MAGVTVNWKWNAAFSRVLAFKMVPIVLANSVGTDENMKTRENAQESATVSLHRVVGIWLARIGKLGCCPVLIRGNPRQSAFPSCSNRDRRISLEFVRTRMTRIVAD